MIVDCKEMGTNRMGTLSSRDFQKEFARAECLPVGSGWFKVVKLPHNVFALMETGHTQGVCSFLILGEQKALLFDTGMGVDDILAVVRQLTDLELVVVNSHSHFDHTGGDWLFEQVHIFDDPYAIDVLTSGYAHADIQYDARPELFNKALPAGFDVETYSVRPVERERIVPIRDGHVFDLGSRQLEVLHTPGHTQDGIMLLDRNHRLLFTGDTYCDFLYAFADWNMPKFGQSNLLDYARSMQRAAQLAPNLDALHPSHGQPLADPALLAKAAAALCDVLDNRAESTPVNLYGERRRMYAFDGFWIFA